MYSKKLIKLVICTFLSLSLVIPNFSFAQKDVEQELTSLADSIIKEENIGMTRSTRDGEQKKYKNVQQFINEAKEKVDITDAKLAKFVADYVGVTNEEDAVSLPQEDILTILSTDVLTEGTTYFKTSKEGKAIPITKEELDSALAEESIQPTNDVNTEYLFPDGYMGINTWVWKKSNTPNGGRVYRVTGTARWYKKPMYFFRDAMAINTTALYYNPVNMDGVPGYPEKAIDVASYGVYARCTHAKCQDVEYGDKHYICDIFGDTVNGDNELVFPGMTGIGYTFKTDSLDHFTMTAPDMATIHQMENWKATGLLATDIYASAGQDFGVQIGYCYHSLSISPNVGISFSAANGVPSIGFSVAGKQTDYLIRPITIHAND